MVGPEAHLDARLLAAARAAPAVAGQLEGPLAAPPSQGALQAQAQLVLGSGRPLDQAPQRAVAHG
jgi:hypothetical protein